MASKTGASSAGPDDPPPVRAPSASPSFSSTTTTTTTTTSSIRSSYPPFVSGALAGSVAAILLQPLDVLKTRVQLSQATHTGAARGAFGIIQSEGAAGLWNGLVPSLGRVCIGAGTYFTALDWMREKVGRSRKRPRPGATGQAQAAAASTSSSPLSPFSIWWTNDFVIGATGRAVAATVTSPLTVVKTRFEAMPGHQRERRGMVATLVHMARHERVSRGLFAGLVPTILRDAPYSGVYFLLYESINGWIDSSTSTNPMSSSSSSSSSSNFPGSAKRSSASKAPADSVPALEQTRSARMTQHLGVGFVAGAIATTLTHPFDVIKTRMQLGDGSNATRSSSSSSSRSSSSSSSSTKASSTLLSTLRDIHQEHGLLRGLMRGVAFRLVRRPLTTAIVWMLYEELS